MARLRPSVLASFLAVACLACGAFREGMEGHMNAVARVDEHTLTIDHAATLMAAAPEEVVPATASAVDVLAGYWVGYTLLASELLSADSLDNVDVTPLIELARDQELVWNLQEDVILARSGPSDAELQESYEREQPFTRVQVQHILIRVPDAATTTQRDTLRRIAESVRERAIAGEDFGALAQEYSDDPTTAPRGGHMGWLQRGRQLPEIESAAFSLEPGAISETVRSSIGYHILKVTDRQAPSLDSVLEEYRSMVVERRANELESAYIDSLFADADMRVMPGALARAKNLVRDPRITRLSAAEREEVLVRYRGGSLTTGEYADFLTKGSQNTWRFVARADSVTLAGVLRELVRNELLVRAARSSGYGLSDSHLDSLRADEQQRLYAAAVTSGLRRPLLISEGTTVNEAVDQALSEVIDRQRSPLPMLQVTPALRLGHVIQIYPDRFPRVLERLRALRAAAIEAQPDTAVRRPDASVEPRT